ncbi:MAG: SDR family oxidoreductase [Clostridiales bacterium]|jgi:NAD(P)-dependent dehydrogenase (short-subunit alcohol dehydrogenase family)|nr:SDR family oxidoreductase [Clostridiales bacterium]
MINLNGKRALVTGAGVGIGKGVAVGLAKCGADVVINYRSSEKEAESLQKEVESLGVKALTIQADVSDSEEVNSMFNIISDRFGDIDILVNNAGVQMNTNLSDYVEEDFLKIFRINLGGYFLCARAALPGMKRQGGGRIINVSSVHSKRPTNFDPGYCMTKGAIKMLTRESAIEFAKYGINVNAIEPGYIEIGKKSDAKNEIVTESMREQPKLFRFMEWYKYQGMAYPDDVAPLVCFLASEESRFVTGASIRIDGGAMLL